MNDNHVIDVSGFFLFEATGDSSEIQSSVMDEDSSAAAAADHHQWSDDDAQSCSGRVFGEVDDVGQGDKIKCASSCLSFEENNEYDDDDAAGGGNETDDDDDDDEEEEVNQGWIMSHVKRGKNKLMRQGSKIWPLGVSRRMKSKKSKGCKLEMMSEKEKDKLFWEACLSQ